MNLFNVTIWNRHTGLTRDFSWVGNGEDEVRAAVELTLVKTVWSLYTVRRVYSGVAA